MLICHCSTAVDVSPFELALRDFRAALPPQERSLFKQCKSSEELINYVQDLDVLKKTQKRGTLMERLSKFGKSFSHYFDVIGILVQSHPEYAALAWGAFRLVLQVRVLCSCALTQLCLFVQLASNFHEFFEKLTKTLSRLGEVLPWYEELTTSLTGEGKYSLSPNKASSRLVSSLTKIYVDLFVFLQSVVRIFTKKDISV